MVKIEGKPPLRLVYTRPGSATIFKPLRSKAPATTKRNIDEPINPLEVRSAYYNSASQECLIIRLYFRAGKPEKGRMSLTEAISKTMNQRISLNKIEVDAEKHAERIFKTIEAFMRDQPQPPLDAPDSNILDLGVKIHREKMELMADLLLGERKNIFDLINEDPLIAAQLLNTCLLVINSAGIRDAKLPEEVIIALREKIEQMDEPLERAVAFQLLIEDDASLFRAIEAVRLIPDLVDRGGELLVLADYLRAKGQDDLKLALEVEAIRLIQESFNGGDEFGADVLLAKLFFYNGELLEADGQLKMLMSKFESGWGEQVIDLANRKKKLRYLLALLAHNGQFEEAAKLLNKYVW